MKKRNNTQKNNNRKIIKVIVVIFMLLLVAFGLKTFIKVILGPSTSDFVSYLENRYGNEQTFSVVGHKANNYNCTAFLAIDTGQHCVVQFSSSALPDKSFDVIYDGEFRDNYLAIKFDSQLKSYFHQLLLGNSDGNYNFLFEVNTKKNLPPNISFDEYVKSGNISFSIVIEDYNNLYPSPDLMDLFENDKLRNVRKIELLQIIKNKTYTDCDDIKAASNGEESCSKLIFENSLTT